MGGTVRIPARSVRFVVVGVLCAAGAGLSAGLSSAAAIDVNISGKWDSVYTQYAASGGNSFPDVLTITQAPGSTTISGTDQLHGTLSGTLSVNSSNQVVLTMTETDGTYVAHFVVTIATSGGKPVSWSGTLSDSNSAYQTSGTDTATFVGTGTAVLAKSGTAAAVSGTVTIETPGQSTFTPLTSSSSIPLGSTIDASAGTVKLTLAKPGKGTETGEFKSGEFMITQSHSGLAKATLEGGSFSACPTTGAARIARAGGSPKGAPVRSLWGHAHGKFQTSGRGGAATVLGTIWLTKDYCNGTLFKAIKDPITVVAFAHPGRRYHVAQGHSIFVPFTGP
jgi:hypothetical protein